MLLDTPNTVKVVGAPVHCNRLLILETGLYPIVDMTSLVRKEKINSTIVALTTYVDQIEGETAYGGLRLDSVPDQITVSDDMQIEVAILSQSLQSFVKAALLYKDQAVGVLDLNKVFNFNVQYEKQGVSYEKQ